MYEIIGEKKYFKDNQDNHVYKIGDKFPHDNREIDEKRIKELMNRKNKLGYAVIKEILPKKIEETKIENKPAKATNKKKKK